MKGGSKMATRTRIRRVSPVNGHKIGRNGRPLGFQTATVGLPDVGMARKIRGSANEALRGHKWVDGCDGHGCTRARVTGGTLALLLPWY